MGRARPGWRRGDPAWRPALGPPVPEVVLSANSLGFGSQVVGSTSTPQTVSLTNSGSADLAISGIAPSGDFAQTNTCGNTVTAGASCTISVTFTPTATGPRSGAVTITDNASGTPPCDLPQRHGQYASGCLVHIRVQRTDMHL
jgi:hypothetical protein